MNEKVFKNYIYNFIYQAIVILFPILTIPYKTRVLGPDNIGIYSYIYSVFSYLLMISTLGINMYGRREIAYNKDNATEKSKIVYELLLIKLILTIIVTISFYFVIGIEGNYKLYYLLMLPDLILNIFDLSWFYQGIEEFKKISIVNFADRILEVISIFVFVKQKTDLVNFFIITAIFDILPIITFIIISKKYLKKVKINTLNIKRHVKMCIILFIPQIFIQAYTVLDKIMLGNLNPNISEVGYYEYSYKIVLLAFQLIKAFIVVMIPVISYESKNKNTTKIKKYMNESVKIVNFIAIPVIFGIIAVSDNLVLVVFGNEYLRMQSLIKLLIICILPMGLTTIIGDQYLVSIKKEKQFSIYIFIGSIINIVLNYILIPKYSSIGAAIATIITEMFVLIIESPVLLKLINTKEIIKEFTKYMFYASIMFAVVYIIGLFESSIITLCIQILVGVIIYLFILISTKDKNFYEIYHKIKK